MTRALAKTGLSERQVYEIVHARMRSLAGPAASDLDDLIQVAAEQVFRSLDRFDGSCTVSTWIYGVCYRVLLNQRRWFRRWKVRFAYLETDDSAPAEQPLPSDLLEARARSSDLHRALSQLSDKYRAVVVLHDLEELKVSEISAIVGANQLTVRSRLRDGRKRLRQLLSEEASRGLLGAHA